jgi:hypothetical protein
MGVSKFYRVSVLPSWTAVSPSFFQCDDTLIEDEEIRRPIIGAGKDRLLMVLVEDRDGRVAERVHGKRRLQNRYTYINGGFQIIERGSQGPIFYTHIPPPPTCPATSMWDNIFARFSYLLVAL